MSFVKYLIGGLLVVVLRGLYDVFTGSKFELTQQNMATYGVTVLIAFCAFAISDYLFKGRS